jgi:hypothetical protein
MLRARLPGVAFAAALLAILGYVAATGLRARGISGLFPAIVGIVGGIAALVNLAQALRGSDPRPAEELPEGESAAWLAGLSYGVPVAYAVLLWLLGFWVASAVTLLALPWMLGYRRKLIVLAVCLGTLAAVELVFVRMFDMTLPRGMLIERLLDEGED